MRDDQKRLVRPAAHLPRNLVAVASAGSSMTVSSFLLGWSLALAGPGHTGGGGSPNWFWIVVIVVAVVLVVWLVGRGGWSDRDRMG